MYIQTHGLSMLVCFRQYADTNHNWPDYSKKFSSFIAHIPIWKAHFKWFDSMVTKSGFPLLLAMISEIDQLNRHKNYPANWYKINPIMKAISESSQINIDLSNPPEQNHSIMKASLYSLTSQTIKSVFIINRKPWVMPTQLHKVKDLISVSQYTDLIITQYHQKAQKIKIIISKPLYNTRKDNHNKDSHKLLS